MKHPSRYVEKLIENKAIRDTMILTLSINQITLEKPLLRTEWTISDPGKTLLKILHL